MHKEVHLLESPVHRHHRFGDNGALCGGHLIQYYAVTLIASDHRKMMSPQLLAGKTKKNPFRMGRAEIRLKQRSRLKARGAPNNTHRHWLQYMAELADFPRRYITCQGSKVFWAWISAVLNWNASESLIKLFVIQYSVQQIQVRNKQTSKADSDKLPHNVALAIFLSGMTAVDSDHLCAGCRDRLLINEREQLGLFPSQPIREWWRPFVRI